MNNYNLKEIKRDLMISFNLLINLNNNYQIFIDTLKKYQ